MKYDVLISVIVPVYNVEGYLKKSVLSILNQTHSNLEVILVDDGSSDNSGIICDELSESDSRIKVIHKENGGLSDARNCGLDASSGDVVSFIDSDDFIDANFFEVLIKNMIDSNADISIGGMARVFGENVQLEEKNKTKLIMNQKDAIQKLNSFGYYGVSVCDKIFKKELFVKNRFKYGKKAEDMFITYNLFLESTTIVYDNSINYYYLQRENSISHGIDSNISYDFIDATEYVASLLKDFYPEFLPDIYTRHLFSYIGVYDKFILSNKKSEADSLLKTIKELKKMANLKILSFKRYCQLFLLVYFNSFYNFIFKKYYYKKNKFIKKINL